VVIAAGNIVALTAVLGSHFENPLFEPIQESWMEKLEEVVTTLDRLADELVIFGEAYEG